MHSVSGFYYLALENVATSRSRKVFTQGNLKKQQELEISKNKINIYAKMPEKRGRNKAKALEARSLSPSHNRIMKSASLSSRYINNTRQLKQKHEQQQEKVQKEQE